MVQVVQVIDDQEFWENIVGSAWETWSWWAKVSYDYHDHTKGLDVSIFDPDVDEIDWDCRDRHTIVTKHLTVEDLAKSYSTLKEKWGSRFYDWDNTDAGSGDVIVQHAILGEVIYG